MQFTRITVRPTVCTGKPCIGDLRFPVSRLLGLLAARMTPEQVARNGGSWAAAARDHGMHRSNPHHLARRLGLRKA